MTISVSGGSPAPQDLDGAWLLDNGQQGLTVECTDVLDLDHIARVVLMAPGAITHHSDMSARYIELMSGLVQGTNNKLLFNIPSNSRLPRGYYMMFVLNSGLIPSVANWVKIR